MVEDFLTLTEIALNYEYVLIDSSIFMGVIENLFLDTRIEDFNSADTYFKHFAQDSLELNSLLRFQRNIFTHRRYLADYSQAMYKLRSEFEKVENSSQYFDFKINEIMRLHNDSCKDLDKFAISLDSSTTEKIEKFNFPLSLNKLSLLYYAALERQNRSEVAIVSKNNLIRRLSPKNFDFEKSPTIYVRNNESLYPFFYLQE